MRKDTMKKLGIAHMSCESVVSIAASIEDEELRNAIIQSDYIRNEVLNRCYAIPSYPHKSLRWKNRYYDVIKRKVIAEMTAQH